MSKIIKAINVMVSNPSLITDVFKGEHETEVFFKYAGKHHWSIIKAQDNNYYLHYYPGAPDLEGLASIPNEAWEECGPVSVTYKSKDLATKEAIDSFSDLYALVNEKVYGMNDVLDEIIDSDSVP